MSRYQSLADRLARETQDQWEATFAEIESALGFALPKSARRYAAWWANQTGSGHSQTHGWRSVGWRTSSLDLKHQRVSFVRDRQRAADGSRTPRSAPRERDALISEAEQLTGIKDREHLVTEALKALVARESAIRLARLGGTMPTFRPAARERP